MNVNPTLMGLASETSLPVYPSVSVPTMAPNAEYITFSYVEDDNPILYADDEDIAGVTTIQIHAFTHTTNPKTLRATIRNYLRNNDFIISAGSTETVEPETDATHSVVEAQIFGDIAR